MSIADPRRSVPRTDAVLNDARLAEPVHRLGRAAVKTAVGTALDRVRAGQITPADAAEAALDVLARTRTGPRAVLNATGVVIHTNLGRAPLAVGAIAALSTAAQYTDVEFDLGTGRRGSRNRGVAQALNAQLPDGADSLVVNNGAAALVLCTTFLAAGREVIISRGEMVEIGDGFRLPALLESTGALLREVGTTNRTVAADYRDALGPDTGAILKVHPSNFRIHGFTSAAAVADLATLGVPVVVDIGSGLLAPDPLLPDEPDARSTLAAGASLVTCSADKLLGGPQGGLIIGAPDLVAQLRRHPLARALRVDKLTLAALEATLRAPTTPTWTSLRAPAEDLRARCESIAGRLVDAGIAAQTVPCEGRVGGGSAPGQALPGWAVALAAGYAAPLRTGDPAVVGRVERDRCLLDPRCVPESQDCTLVRAVLAARPAVDGSASSGAASPGVAPPDLASR